MHGFVCSPRTYRYRGWLFEWHPWGGPWPLRKDGELRARAGRKFFVVANEWADLPERDREACRVGGGCVRI